MNRLLINEQLQSTSKDISLDNGINKNKTHTQSAYKTLHADIVKKKPTYFFVPSAKLEVLRINALSQEKK